MFKLNTNKILHLEYLPAAVAFLTICFTPSDDSAFFRSARHNSILSLRFLISSSSLFCSSSCKECLKHKSTINHTNKGIENEIYVGNHTLSRFAGLKGSSSFPSSAFSLSLSLSLSFLSLSLDLDLDLDRDSLDFTLDLAVVLRLLLSLSRSLSLSLSLSLSFSLSLWT